MTFDLAGIQVDIIELSRRPYNAFLRSGRSSLLDLLQSTRDDLLKIRNMGLQSADEIINKMEKYIKDHYNVTYKEFMTIYPGLWTKSVK